MEKHHRVLCVVCVMCRLYGCECICGVCGMCICGLYLWHVCGVFYACGVYVLCVIFVYVAYVSVYGMLLSDMVCDMYV